MNEELCADLFAGLIFGDHMQNPALRSRQTFESRFIFQQSLRSVAAIQKVRNKWVAYVKLPRRKGVDGFGNFDECAVLEDVALDPQVHGRMEDRFLVVNRKKDNIDGNLSFVDFLRYREAVLLRHIDIDDRDLGPALLNLREQSFSVTRFHDHFYVGIGFKHLAKPFA